MSGDVMRAMNAPKQTVEHPAVKRIGEEFETPEPDEYPPEDLQRRQADLPHERV